MNTPLQGFFISAGLIGFFIAGHFTTKIPALWILIIPVAMLFLVSLVFCLSEAFGNND